MESGSDWMMGVDCKGSGDPEYSPVLFYPHLDTHNFYHTTLFIFGYAK